jgi:hypothetical protein
MNYYATEFDSDDNSINKIKTCKICEKKKTEYKICYDCKRDNKCVICNENFADPKYGNECYKCKFPNTCRKCLKRCSEKYNYCYNCKFTNSKPTLNSNTNISSGCLFLNAK